MQNKLFIGTRVTPDLKFRMGSTFGTALQVIPFDGKEFVGNYVTDPTPTVLELRKLRCAFIEALQLHLPDLRADMLPVVVFPQMFLG